MLRRFLAILIALITVTLQLLSQNATHAIRINVPVVALEALVLDSNGRPVTSLRRGDFSIYEDGQRKEFQNFSSVETPYSIMLIFQNTRTVLSHRSFFGEASNRFLGGLRSQDRVSVYTIEDILLRALVWRNAKTGNPQDIRIGPPQGSNKVHDAIDNLYGKFDGTKGRKGVVLLTSGQDNDLYAETMKRGRVPTAAEDQEFQKLLKKVAGRGIPLYVVAVNTDRNLISLESIPAVPRPTIPVQPPRGGQTTGNTIPTPNPLLNEYVYLRDYYIKSPQYLKIEDRSPTVADDFLLESRSRVEQLAELSSGRIYFPRTIEEVSPLYEQIAKELGTSYSFGYAPGNFPAGTTHRIEVRVSDPTLRVVQSRESYKVR